ncbi:uncharacterized protein Dana_GF12076, isoform B [Drosophila ananassae]|uniref:Uncharacterized protein, isoform A n=1 Tax=Drosophila ananassae TaxID=7217 RepID=B3MC89_DROAN|nr:uncharacterized protein LOC6494934 [Drosophila ananassae]XP_044571107.1 uncharacterized protein LOC6494934 [Drosophila ananassae]EDV36189.1 uncharacterized protein Dana_GF12076, isoform A [Drosophila ananassae]KPU76065.1 uncharacterized protein Dana_GF12076, isoform B [Drosophila ananassae]
MRERSQTTPRRRRAGPKQALPGTSSEGVGALESPYYTIDNTEDIYGTTLLPSQRCYVDPWDLENYDYVRKKIDDVTVGHLGDEPTYGTGHSLTPSPTYGYGAGMSATMPRPHTETRRVSRAQCQLECCVPQRSRRRSRSARKEPLYTARSDIYGAPSRYEDYMATMTRELHLNDGEEEYGEREEVQPEDIYGEEQRQLYNGFGGFSSASSTEHPSSIGDEMTYPVAQRRATTLQRRSVPSQVARNNINPMGYGTAPHPRRKRSGKAVTSQATPPQIDFPAPPPLSPAYDYCNPYATLPYCSLPDCSECQQQATSLIYAAPSTLYGTLGGGQRGASPHSSGGGDSSLYSGIYARKFGLSKKGLLQIDYSCSWNDLDRVMQRHF